MFYYDHDELFAENVTVRSIAEEYGTPLYIYSKHTLQQNYLAFAEAFRDTRHLICYALKANSNQAVLRTLAEKGSGADMVSSGELLRALRAGIPASKIVFSGVGKTEPEMREALRRGILMFNVESEEELHLLNMIAKSMNRKAPIGLRVNPDVDPKTHPYISTGLKEHKFGVPIQKAHGLYRLAARLKFLDVVGIHMHLGSQISKVAPFQESLRRVLALLAQLRKDKMKIRYLDIGGGVGIRYKTHSEELPPAQFARAIQELAVQDLTLILEPGRSIAGNAGILVTRVLYRKKNLKRQFIVVDAGMNDLIRPSLYNAYHEIIPVIKRKRPLMTADIVGPVCETGDFLAHDRRIVRADAGDLLAVLSAGAYGYSMSSNYNSRLRPAEIMVSGTRAALVGRRETYRDLLRREVMLQE